MKNILYHEVFMKEIIEFRIPEVEAQKYLYSDEGQILSGSVRRLIIPLADERIRYIEKIYHKIWLEGGLFVTSWKITRKYNDSELLKTELFKVIIKKVFEPAGEECGTIYDESVACPNCGLDRKQTGDLFLDLNKISNKLDIVKTIAGEVIVSDRFVETWKNNSLKGAVFRNVIQKGNKNSISQRWYQVDTTSSPLEITIPTKAGNNIFDNDIEGKYKCPGHVLGLNLTSELFVTRKSFNGSDISITQQAFGWKQGLLRPERPFIVSQKAWNALCKDGMKGFDVEVVHLNDGK
jgi:hypothetical protein